MEFICMKLALKSIHHKKIVHKILLQYLKIHLNVALSDKNLGKE